QKSRSDSRTRSYASLKLPGIEYTSVRPMDALGDARVCAPGCMGMDLCRASTRRSARFLRVTARGNDDLRERRGNGGGGCWEPCVQLQQTRNSHEPPAQVASEPERGPRHTHTARQLLELGIVLQPGAVLRPIEKERVALIHRPREPGQSLLAVVQGNLDQR